MAAPSSSASQPSRARGSARSRSSAPAPEVELAVGVERAAAEHGPLRQRAADQIGGLGVERAARARADRTGRAAEPVDDLPAVDGQRRAEPAAELEQHEPRLLVGDPEALGLVGDPERGARDLVGGPQVDAVPLAVVRDGGEVDRARPEDERDAGRDQRPHDRAHPGDAGARLRLVGALEHHQRELALADLRGRDEREPVAGRPEHEVERRVGAERVDERRRVGAERRGREALLQQRQPAVERAQLEGDGAGIDAGDARTARLRRASSFAIS